MGKRYYWLCRGWKKKKKKSPSIVGILYILVLFFYVSIDTWQTIPKQNGWNQQPGDYFSWFGGLPGVHLDRFAAVLLGVFCVAVGRLWLVPEHPWWFHSSICCLGGMARRLERESGAFLSLHVVLEPFPSAWPFHVVCPAQPDFSYDRSGHPKLWEWDLLGFLKAQNWHGVTSSIYCWLKQDTGVA